jgi:hypothetical protein
MQPLVNKFGLFYTPTESLHCEKAERIARPLRHFTFAMAMAHSTKAASPHRLRVTKQTFLLPTAKALLPTVLTGPVSQLEEGRPSDLTCLRNDERYRDGLKFE